MFFDPRRSRPWCRSACLVCLILVALAPLAGGSARAQATPVAQAGVGDRDPVLYDAILTNQREAIIADTNGRLPRYRIEADLVPATSTAPAMLTGEQDLLFVNGTGVALPDLYVRLYANEDINADGGLVVQDVTVDDVSVAPELSVGDTVLRVALAAPVAPGGTVRVQMAFTTTIPVSPSQGYGMFGYATEQGTFSLAAHWYPILAGYDPTTGWVLAPPSRIGDPVFSNAALYDVGLTAPAGLILVTSGREVGTEDRSGRTRHRYVTGPARDFTIVGDNDFASLSEEVDGTTLTSYFDPSRPEGGREILREAAQALALFNDLFGAYPYVELDLVEMPLRGAAGIEFPQLIYVDDNYYARAAGEPAEPGRTASVVAHEVAHQWWYGLVGNDQYAHAFTDEGLTNYVTTVYYEKVYGPERGQLEIDRLLKAPYFALLFSGEDQIVDQPTDDFRNGTYGVTIYCKAALGFGAIRADIGDDAFFGALTAYAARFRFAVATPDDLLAAFNQAAGRDLNELWRHWFEAAEGRQDYDWADAMALLRELGR